jgi:alpha-L-fucosidase
MTNDLIKFLGVLQPHKWENAMTLDAESWGYRRNSNIEEYLTPEQLMTTIVESVSCGGMYKINSQSESYENILL